MQDFLEKVFSLSPDQASTLLLPLKRRLFLGMKDLFVQVK